MKMKVPTVNVAQRLLRDHAAPIPSIVPMKKLRIVASPINPSVHGIAIFKTSLTGVGKRDNEMPRSPFSKLSKYLPYWTINASFVSNPKAIRIDSIDSGGMPCIRSINSLAGSPGINRGMKKFNVIATNRANSNRPILRKKYFTISSHPIRSTLIPVAFNLADTRLF